MLRRQACHQLSVDDFCDCSPSLASASNRQIFQRPSLQWQLQCSVSVQQIHPLCSAVLDTLGCNILSVCVTWCARRRVT